MMSCPHSRVDSTKALKRAHAEITRCCSLEINMDKGIDPRRVMVQEWLHPTEPLKHFRWQSGVPELIKLGMDGRCQWSAPFAISSEGMMSACLKNGLQSEHMDLSIEVRGGAKTCHYEVILRPSSSSLYRIENNTLALQILFRQVNDGDDPLKSLKYDIDEIKDHRLIQVVVGPRRNLRVNIIREEKTSFVSDNEFDFKLKVVELGLSIVDHTPEEILYLSLKNFLLSYSTGPGSGTSRIFLYPFKLDHNSIYAYAKFEFYNSVLFRLQRVGDDSGYILELSITQQYSGSLDLFIYPDIGLQGPRNTAFLVNIYEPIIWRQHDLIQKANVSRIFLLRPVLIPSFKLGIVLNISEVHFKVTIVMSPTQRPTGVLGFWANLIMTSIGNTRHAPVSMSADEHELPKMHMFFN
ncbi:hypothetical protein C2S53_018849 [Perilla frutescens var. hirtella]|uniref:Uncharacterized protein n=1 Tax=Perilla frutescens var. hirtella TaxID=608512 RepID=A0AAD4IUP1_PERFH|nr:hypothetical protein C2S53_018849 [Perilla frutescens var. hirtella]